MPRDKATARQFVAHGEPADGAPDPVLQTIEDLRGQVEALKAGMREMEDRLRRAGPRGKRPAGERVGPDAARVPDGRRQSKRPGFRRRSLGDVLEELVA